MGDPVSASIALAGTGFATETGAALLGGRQQRAAYKMEAVQLETQKKAIETNVAIAQEERLRNLKKTLAVQNAVFAMAGQPTGFGSAGAIQTESMSEANKERRMQKLQKDIAVGSITSNILSAKQASKQAMQTSLLNFAVDYSSRAFSAGMKNYITQTGAKK